MDRAAADVLAAFEGAEKARLPLMDCYLAGVGAWRQAHPDHAPTYAAQRAVSVILEAKVSLRVPDEWPPRGPPARAAALIGLGRASAERIGEKRRDQRKPAQPAEDWNR
jgi:hypothetical protein